MLSEFAVDRASGIGATDSPKILGLSKWGTPLTVYRDKTAPTEGPMSLPAWLGLKLQSTVAEMYTTATGQKLRADNRHHRHPEHDWMVCHLDYRAWGTPELLVECKTRAYGDGYGPDGSQEIPADVWVQCQHEMAVTGATRCDLAVLIGHHTFNVYPLTRDDDFIDKMIPQLRAFWFDNVLAGVPPLPTGHDLDTAAVKAEFPDHNDDLKPATAEQILLANNLRVARLQTKEAERAQAGVENQLKEVIGEAAGIVGPFGQITWKKRADSVSTDWEAVAATYVNVIEELLELTSGAELLEDIARRGRARAAYVAAEGLYTSTKPGVRVFRADLKESE